MLVGIPSCRTVRGRRIASDGALHILDHFGSIRVLLLLEHTRNLPSEETGGKGVVPGQSEKEELIQTEIASLVMRPAISVYRGCLLLVAVL